MLSAPTLTPRHNGLAQLWPEADRPASSAGEPTLLHLAVDRSDVAEVERLLAEGADVNAVSFFGLTPLHLCARRYGQRRQAYVSAVREDIVCRMLLAAGANVRARDFHGVMPAAWAEGHMPESLKTAVVGCARAGAWPPEGHDADADPDAPKRRRLGAKHRLVRHAATARAGA